MSILSANNLALTSNTQLLSQEEFKPTQLLNCRLWLRSDLGVTQSGGLVSAWGDQTANGFNAVQAVGSQQPVFASSALNGKPAIRFTGPDDLLKCTNAIITGTGEFTIFTVMVQTNAPTGAHITGNYSSTNTTGIQCWLSGGSIIQLVPGSGANVGGTTALSLFYPWILYWDRVGTTVNLRVNGTLEASAVRANSIAGSDTWSIGNYTAQLEPFTGDIFEIIVFNRGITDTERTQVTNYLKIRYGIL